MRIWSVSPTPLKRKFGRLQRSSSSRNFLSSALFPHLAGKTVRTVCRHLLAPALGLLLVAAGKGQSYIPGSRVFTFVSEIDDSRQSYALHLPPSYDAAKKYPLVITLHSMLPHQRIRVLRDLELIVATPQGRVAFADEGVGEKDLYDLLADVQRRFSIDPDRVYLVGLSMSGGAALRMVLTRPDTWAAAALVSAALPSGIEELTGNALNVPIHLFHGDQDPAVPVESSRHWYRQLLSAGIKAEYVEYPGVRHNSWDVAYRNGALFDWWAGLRRDLHPERVVFSTRAYKYRQAYWVQFDALTPGELASVDARFTADNKLSIQSEKLDGFTLRLAGHRRFSAQSPMVISVDGATLRLKPSDTISFMKTSKGWKPGKREPPPGGKRAGLEGPIKEAIAARHIYVYGTADSPGEEERQQRKAVAAHAAHWSRPRTSVSISFPVKADREVRDDDLARANLILFGTRETNTIVARFADQLIFSLNPGAADYGLVFVAPINGRYVVVNSGLPWWTGADQVKRLGFRFAPPPYRVLQSFGDFVLFKGSLETIIAEGRFDANWKVPPKAAEKMKRTGAVVVR